MSVRRRPQVRLIDLYQGEAWQEVRGLSDDARHAGYSVHHVGRFGGPWPARRFDAGEPIRRDLRRWPPRFGGIQRRGEPRLVATSSRPRIRAVIDRRRDDRVLLVLSETYARSMEHDLIALADRGGDLLLVGGARDIDGLARLPADRSLRRRTGRYRLQRWPPHGPTVASLPHRHRPVHARRTRRRGPTGRNRWLARRTTTGRRRPMPTSLSVIDKLLADEPGLSATRALRRVRDAGIACEQKRFGRLFHSVVDAR